jgi:hypothetical protein
LHFSEKVSKYLEKTDKANCRKIITFVENIQ